MKALIPATVIAFASAAALFNPAAAQNNKVTTPDQIVWGAGPASLPPGAEAAVLYGDPAKDGLFALRLKLPKGYIIPPHSHGKPEVVTVMSGTFRLGMGEKADNSKAEALPAGSFFAIPPGTAHFASADEDTVVQLNSIGPWTIMYVNPMDDPRQKSQ